MCVSRMWMWRVCVTHINEICVFHTIFETCVRHTFIRVVYVSHTGKRDTSVSQYSSRMCDTNVNETCACHTIYETRVCHTCQRDVKVSHIYYARNVCEIYTMPPLVSCFSCVTSHAQMIQHIKVAVSTRHMRVSVHVSTLPPFSRCIGRNKMRTKRNGADVLFIGSLWCLLSYTEMV